MNMLKTWQIRHEPTCDRCMMPLGVRGESQREVEEWIEKEEYGKICRYCDSYLDNIMIVAVPQLCPDPIATVRQVHPYAYCRPPLATGTPWAVMHHPADHFCGAPIAEGPTEAAAWLAAAERVCA